MMNTRRPLGKNQLRRLAGLSDICRAQVVGDALSNSLVNRGLLAADPDGSFAHITSSGLRQLADAIEAGRLEGFKSRQLL